MLWTRLAPDPLMGGGMPDRAIAVLWEIASDDHFRGVVRRGVELARPQLGHSVHIEVGGLRPGAWYWYRFRTMREVSPVGRTRTAPAVGAPTDRLAFALTSCQAYTDGYFTAHRHMAEEDLDLVVQVGDYIYEGAPNPASIRVHEGTGEPVTLEQYRNRHAQYRGDADLQACHAAFPWLVVLDDHEIDNNWADEVPQDPALQPRDTFLARRATAFQAYYEHMPLRRSSIPSGIDIQLFRRSTFGDLLDVHVLDTRQYRSDQDQTRRLDPSRTILGDEQERWLLDNLAGTSRPTSTTRRRRRSRPSSSARRSRAGATVWRTRRATPSSTPRTRTSSTSTASAAMCATWSPGTRGRRTTASSRSSPCRADRSRPVPVS